MLARSWVPSFALTLALTPAWMLSACSATTAGLGDAGVGSDSETGEDSGFETGSGAGDEAGTADGSGDEASTSSEGDGDGDGDGGGDGDGDPDTAEATDGPECGDGFVDPGEDCDADQLGGSDCAALGFLAGALACADDCSFDTSACVDQVCGNGVIEGRESCDKGELGGADCLTLGFGKGGAPTCTDACEIDTSSCPPPGEGESCGWGEDCPFNYLTCVGGTCYDGSVGDPCDFGWECQGGLSCPLLGGNCQL